MQAIKTASTNVTYVAEGCHDLPATLISDQDGQEHVETCWTLSDEELKQVIRDRKIYLTIVGRSVPPLNVTAESMFEFKEE